MDRPILSYIMLAIEIAVAVLVLFRWKHVTNHLRLIVLLLIITPAIAITELWMGFNGIRNLWVAHIATLLEYVLILSTYYIWEPKIINKRILLICIISFIVLWMISKYTFESFNFLDIYTSIIAKIIEIITSALVLFDVLQDANIELKTDARLWISSGVIIYATGTLFLFALFNMMLDTSPELIRTLWPINWILSIVFTLLLARGVWCKATR